MIRGTIHTDPYAGTEVMLIELGEHVFGLAYDPRKTDPPVPWSSRCRHCQHGHQQDLSPSTRREIKMLLSKKTGAASDVYEVPTNGSPLAIAYWTQGKSQHATVVKKGRSRSRLRLRASRRVGQSLEQPLVLEGDLPSFKSPILLRCLRFLFCQRRARPEEVAACLRPMLEMQLAHTRRPRTRGGRRLACREIKWTDVAGVAP